MVTAATIQMHKQTAIEAELAGALSHMTRDAAATLHTFT